MTRLTEAGQDAKKVKTALSLIRGVSGRYDRRSPLGRLLNDSAANLQIVEQVLGVMAWWKANDGQAR